MKQLFLFLFCLVSTITSSQVVDKCVFDFTSPQSLNPSITPLHGNAQIVMVTDKVFKNGPIYISFKNGSVATGAQIVTTKRGNSTETYNLRITSTTTMTIFADEGVSLKAIQMSDDSTVGDLSVTSEDAEKGELDGYDGYRSWKPAQGVTEVDSLSLLNSGSSTDLKQLTVTYSTPSDILEPISDINTGATIDEFSVINLEFSSDISISDASNIRISSNDGTIDQILSASVEGNMVKLSANKPIEHDDTYTIEIPANAFSDSKGYTNKALTYTFNVVVPKNTFDYNSISLEPGRVDAINNDIILTYPNMVGSVSEQSFIIYKNGEAFRQVKLSKVADDDYKVKISFVAISSPITEYGTYKLTIKEGSIFNAFPDDTQLKRYNPNIDLEYVISNEPLEDSETMKIAKSLIETAGVGYPSADSPSRVALASLVESESVPSDTQLSLAIEDFYEETQITLPTSDKWYNICNVNAAGEKLYLEYKSGKVLLGNNPATASPFKATLQSDGKITFTTTDGKYLHLLSAEDEKYIGTSSSCVTSEYTPKYNDLTIGRMIVNDVDAKNTFGLMSVYGCLGKDAVMENDVYAYALVNHKNDIVVTSPEYGLLFTENNSSAFAIAETVKPEDIVPPVELECTLSPEVVNDNSEKITVTFSISSQLFLSEEVNPYITDLAGEKIAEVVLNQIEGQDKSFEFALDELPNGNYCIVFPEGAFTTLIDGKKANSVEMKKYFSIGKSGEGETEGFNYSFSTFGRWGDSENMYVTDQIFNNYILFVPKNDLYTGMVPDETKEVIITDYFSISNVRARGHFVPYTIPEAPNYPAIRLELDQPIASLPKGQYAVIVPKATFGDLNFGKYLVDKTSVKASDCIVNDYFSLLYLVDNVLSVDSIELKSNSMDKIYDIMGRPVNSMDKKGVYIYNGKKIVK